MGNQTCCAENQPPADEKDQFVQVTPSDEAPKNEVKEETKAPEPPKEEPKPEPVKEEPKKVEETNAPPPVKEAASVVFVFDANGSSKEIKVMNRPLGLLFEPYQPIAVREVRKGSVCEGLQVQGGWKLKSVGGVDVSGMSVKAASDKCLEACQALPTVSGSVTMIVQGASGEKTVVASRRPFGVSLMGNNVQSVTPGSHAESLGVVAGMTVKSINGSSVTVEDCSSIMASAFAACPSLQFEA